MECCRNPLVMKLKASDNRLIDRHSASNTTTQHYPDEEEQKPHTSCRRSGSFAPQSLQDASFFSSNPTTPQRTSASRGLRSRRGNRRRSLVAEKARKGVHEKSIHVRRTFYTALSPGGVETQNRGFTRSDFCRHTHFLSRPSLPGVYPYFSHERAHTLFFQDCEWTLCLWKACNVPAESSGRAAMCIVERS
jgi:hypothetical protein